MVKEHIGVKGEMESVVDNVMRATFDDMLGWPLQSAAGRMYAPLDMPVSSHVLLREGNVAKVDVVLQFDQRLLALAGAELYPPDMLDSSEMFNDMASEIANIIAGRINAHLNASGGALQMALAETPAVSINAAAPNGVDVSFQYDNGGTPKPLGVIVSVHLRGTAPD